MTPRINRRVPCSDTHRPKWIPIHFYVQGQNITLPKSLTKIDSGAFIRSDLVSFSIETWLAVDGFLSDRRLK
jgi:hypothetical protein